MGRSTPCGATPGLLPPPEGPPVGLRLVKKLPNLYTIVDRMIGTGAHREALAVQRANGSGGECWRARARASALQSHRQKP